MPGSLRASARGLEIVERARKNKGWTRTVTVAWWQAALTSQATLRRFWRQQPIQQEAFINICKAVGLGNWEQIADNSALEKPIYDWGQAPEVSIFYGRTKELMELEQWIVEDGCRLVALQGMGGIGKTALSVILAEQIQNKFEYFIWRSLRYVPSVEDLLTELIGFLSNGQATDLPQNASRRVASLLEYLRSHRCLLILDQVETILRDGQPAGYYLEKYADYGELIQRVGRERHNSCLLLISREQLNDVALMQLETQFVRSFSLSNLNDAEAREIFRSKGLSDQDNWGELIKIYRCNPLFLNIIAAYIRHSFAGSVSNFLQIGTTFIGDIAPILDTLWNRLSPFEQEITCLLALNPNAISIPALKNHISGLVSYSAVMEALQSLERRSLIEKQTEGSEVLYTLQPVVRRFVKRKCNQTVILNNKV